MKQYVVDAFTDQVFHGNQAAVCVLAQWLPEELMMNITRENNFSETAFTVREGEKWHLRWFTPGGEIDLCGHATLATAFVLLKHNTQVVLDEIVSWAKEGVAQLGCSPCTLAVGVGRSHFEAASLMLQAQVDGNYDVQSDMEREITRRVNEANIGPLGLGGDTSVIATFLKVGPQRASGVRIVCVRPTCCFEPRIATVELPV